MTASGNGKQGKSAAPSELANMTTASAEVLESYYDGWAASYDQDLAQMGYAAPQVTAGILRQQGVDAAEPVLDAGCGTGLTGLALQQQGYTRITGIDLSNASLDEAKKKGCYTELKQQNLDQRLDLADDAFAGAQCVGTLTYVRNMDGLMREFCRVVRPGGIVAFTNRVDLYDDAFREVLDRLVKEGLWTLVSHSDPKPYLPEDEEFGKDKAIIYDVYRVN